MVFTNNCIDLQIPYTLFLLNDLWMLLDHHTVTMKSASLDHCPVISLNWRFVIAFYLVEPYFPELSFIPFLKRYMVFVYLFKWIDGKYIRGIEVT